MLRQEWKSNSGRKLQMGQPTAYQWSLHQQAHPGARILSPSGSSQGGPVQVNRGDIVPAISGWHVVLRPHALPAQGYPLGYSDENVHYSTGPSFSGQGCPQSVPASVTFDQVGSGVGSDGRIANQDGTYGNGSPSRGF
jgi:hypothetical protein